MVLVEWWMGPKRNPWLSNLRDIKSPRKLMNFWRQMEKWSFTHLRYVCVCGITNNMNGKQWFFGWKCNITMSLPLELLVGVALVGGAGSFTHTYTHHLSHFHNSKATVFISNSLWNYGDISILIIQHFRPCINRMDTNAFDSRWDIAQRENGFFLFLCGALWKGAQRAIWIHYALSLIPHFPQR